MLSAVDGPKENRQSILDEKGWQDWFLDLLLDSSALMQSRSLYPNTSTSTAATEASWDVGRPLDLLGGQPSSTLADNAEK